MYNSCANWNTTGRIFEAGNLCGKSMKICHLRMTSDRKNDWWRFCQNFTGQRLIGAGIATKGFHVTNSTSLEGERSQIAIPNHDDGTSGTGFAWSDKKKPRICVLGGGFGGLYTALRLESLTWAPDKRPQVVLIDQSDRFVFKPLLYELLSKEVDQWEIAPHFKDLLANTSIQFVKDTVKAVLPYDSIKAKMPPASTSTGMGGKVFLGSGTEVTYDWLVLALGAESRLENIPGALKFALPFATLEDAVEVDKRLVTLERERFGSENLIQIVVVGSGYCGVELAATLAERLGNRGKLKVVDVTEGICPAAPVGNRKAALKVLSSRGVELVLGCLVSRITGPTTAMSSADGNQHVMEAGAAKIVVDLTPARKGLSRRNGGRQQIQADLVLWTVGTRATVPPSEPDTDCKPFPVNGRGQADTDENLRVKGHPRIFAIGDSAGMKDSSGRLLPTTAQVAFQQADYVGWNLWAAINNRPLLPFRYQHLGEMMTLGRTEAAVSISFLENTTLDGLIGHSARKLAYLYRLPTNEHKAKVALSWFGKSAISSVSAIQNELIKVLGF